LASTASIVDEIIVVDTGSTDRTVEIAHQFGAKVSSFSWTNDFAAARNAALDQATGDWIFSLDADEELDVGSGQRLRTIIELPTPKLRSYGIQVKNIHNREEIPLIYLSYAKRLFPRHPRVRWVRPIHEQVVHLDDENLLDYVLTDQIVITHYGYARDIWEAKDKARRNRDMLEKAIKDNPNSAFDYYNLGQEHYTARRFSEALDCFERALALAKGATVLPNYYAYVYALAAGSCVETKHLDRGIEIGEEGLARFEYADLLVNLGSCYLLRGDFDQAVRCYTRARTLDGVQNLYSGDIGSTTWRPAQNLGDAYMLRGDPGRALEFFHQAIAANPDRPYPNLRAAAALIALGRGADAKRYIQKVLAILPEHEEAHLVWVDYLIAISDRPGSLEYNRMLVDTWPAKARFRIRLAELLLDRGDPESALPILQAGMTVTEGKGLLHQRLGVTLNRLRKFSEAVEAFAVAVAIDPSDLRSQLGMEAARLLSTEAL
jgi:tetratricopeptide (TPR) repeat protein